MLIREWRLQRERDTQEADNCTDMLSKVWQRKGRGT